MLVGRAVVVGINFKTSLLVLYASTSLIISIHLLVFISRWTGISLVSEASNEEVVDYSISQNWECYYVERGHAYEWEFGLAKENRFKFLYLLMVFFMCVAPFLYLFLPIGLSLMKEEIRKLKR